MSIETRLKEIRNHLGLTQAKFGESLGVSRDVINTYEHGKVAPTPLFINHLCSKYEISQTWLETGLGEMHTVQNDDKEFAEFAKKILNGNDPFKKKVLIALSQMDDAAFEAFVRFYEAMKNYDFNLNENGSKSESQDSEQKNDDKC